MVKLVLLSSAFAASLIGQPRPTIVSGDYRAGTFPIAPGQVIPLTVHGLSAPVQDTFAESSPLPRQLAGFEIKLKQPETTAISLPILSVTSRSSCLPSLTHCEGEPMAVITVQIPYTLRIPNRAVTIPCCDSVLSVYENGVRRGETRVEAVLDQIRLVSRCDIALPYFFRIPVGRFGDACETPIFDARGEQLDMGNQAKGGDTLTVYAWGLGELDAGTPPADRIVEGQAPQRPVSVGADKIVVRYDFDVNGAVAPGPTPTAFQLEGYRWAGLIPGSVGLYQINLKLPPVPPGTPACDTPINPRETVSSNLTITIRGWASYDGVRLCVEP